MRQVNTATQACSYDNIDTAASVSSHYEHKVGSLNLSKSLDADTDELHTLSYVLSDEDCTTLHELKATLHSLQHSLEALNTTVDHTVLPPLTVHPPISVPTDLSTPNLEPVVIESVESGALDSVCPMAPPFADTVGDAIFVYSSVEEQATISEDRNEVDKGEAGNYTTADGKEQSTLYDTPVRAQQLNGVLPLSLPANDLPSSPPALSSPLSLLPVDAYIAESHSDIASTSVETTRLTDLPVSARGIITDYLGEQREFVQKEDAVEEEEVVDQEEEVIVTGVELVEDHSSDVTGTDSISLKIATDQQSQGLVEEQAYSSDVTKELAATDLVLISPSSSSQVDQSPPFTAPLSDDSHAVDIAVRSVDEAVVEEDALARFEAYFTPRTSSNKSSGSSSGGSCRSSKRYISPRPEASSPGINITAIGEIVEVALLAPSPDTLSSAASHRAEILALGDETDADEALYAWDHSYALHPDDVEDGAEKSSLLGGESEQHDVLVHVHTEKDTTALLTILPSPTSSPPPLEIGDTVAAASPDLSSRSAREVQIDAPGLEKLEEEVVFAAPSDDYKPPSSGSSVDLVDVDGGRCKGRVQSTATAHAAVSARINDTGISGLGEVTESEIPIREREVNPVLSAPAYSTDTPSMKPTEAVTIPTTPCVRLTSPAALAVYIPYSPPAASAPSSPPVVTDHIQAHQPRHSLLGSPLVKSPLPKPPSIDIASLVRKVLLQPPLPSPTATTNIPAKPQQSRQLITTAQTSTSPPTSQRPLHHASGSSSTRQRTFLDLETDRVSRVMLRGTCDDIHT